MGGIEGLSIRTIYRCMAMADKLPTLADVERHNNLTKAYVAVGMLPESEETPKPIGTAEIDMFEGFVKSVLKDVTRLTSRFDGLDTSNMPADRKAEIIAAIERLETLKSELSA